MENMGRSDHTPVGVDPLVTVIGDFLEMGHVDNIIAMFQQDSSVYALTGAVLKDERFKVRMGVAVLFEELAKTQAPKNLNLAVHSLARLAADPAPYVRGDAATVLAIIHSAEAMKALRDFENDPDPQVREIVADALGS